MKLNIAENARGAMQNSTVTLEDYDAALPEHKQQFGALNREWLTKYFYVEDQDEAAFADPEGKILKKGGVILFARAEGKVVGTGSLVPLEEKGYFEIAKMAVTEAWQKHRIGQQMMAALIERARAIKARKLYIVSNTKLENAIRLYRRHGFNDSAEARHAHYDRGNITLELPLV